MPVIKQNPPPSPNPGDPYDAQREGAHIRASDDSQTIIEAIYNYLDQFPPTLINDAVTGLLYNVLAQPAGNGIAIASAPSPFQVTIQEDPSSPGSYQASVYWNSSLLLSTVLTDTQPITGLAAWFTLDLGNDLIWLDITLDGFGDVTGATINSYGLGGSWNPSDPPQVFGTGSGPFEYEITFDANGNQIISQYMARIPIFESVTSTASPFPISNIQLLNQNLIMEGDIDTGSSGGPGVTGLLMPKPFAGPYVST